MKRRVSKVLDGLFRRLTPFQKGNRLFARGRYEEALRQFVKHAEMHPAEAAHALANAGKCCGYLNVVKKPRPVAPGVTLVAEGDVAGAERFYRAALEADPQHFPALSGLAGTLSVRSPERLRTLERAAALREDALVLLQLGDYYRSVLKDVDKAHAVYVRLVNAHPRDKTGYLRLNDLCRRMGRPDEAKEWSARWQKAKKTRMNRGTV
jgi:tetratricopeptide (TPR) repeat protein